MVPDTFFFFQPAVRSVYQALCQLLHDVPAVAKTKQAYIYVYGDNTPSRRVIEKIGFRYVGSLIEDRRLFTARRYAVSGGGPFRTALLDTVPTN
jgi:RimJ/RimL family protein N-acetyltransferase